MRFNINNKLTFSDCFQFLSSSFDSLLKNLGKTGFKYLNQEFINKILDLLKQKEFYPYEFICSFEKIKEELPSKERFYSSLTGEGPNLTDKHKEYEHVEMFGIHSK